LLAEPFDLAFEFREQLDDTDERTDPAGDAPAESDA
jgi:hypothetical protein